MRFQWDRQYLKYTFYASLTIIIGIVVFHVLDNLSVFMGSIRSGFEWFWRLMRPFTIAFFIAYLLNPGVRWFETRGYGRFSLFQRRRNLCRSLSILTVFAILGGFVAVMVVVIVPQIVSNIQELGRQIPNFARSVENFALNWPDHLGALQMYGVDLQMVVEPLEQNVARYMDQANQLVEQAVTGLISRFVSFTSTLFNFILGLVVSFYALADKESFKNGADRILRAFMPTDRVEQVKAFGREADYVFSRFILGKSLDSIIVGVLCYIGMWVLDIQFALLLSVFVGVTNMIPYLGPVFGMIPAGLLTLFDSPIKALWVILFLLALQQLDGFYIGPKVLGSSMGMPTFWVIFAIIIGGKLYGIIGMFIGVPVFGVLWLLISRILNRLETRYTEKKIKET